MYKRRTYYPTKSRPKVKVLAQSYDRHPMMAWLAALATAALAIFYFYSLFFCFPSRGGAS